MKELKIATLPNPRLLLMAVALTAFTASHAFAATLRQDATLTAEKVTVGDIFDGAGEYAERYLAPAPAPGKTLTLTTQDLTRISEAFDLGWRPNTGAERVTLTRISQNIDRYDIQAALHKKLSDTLQTSRLEMDLGDGDLTLNLPAGTDKTVGIDNLSIDAARGTFTATAFAEAKPALKREVKGRFTHLLAVPVLKNPLRPGDIISANDLDHIEMRMSDIAPTMVVADERLIGQTPRRGLTALKPVLMADIQPPVIVKKGDLVILTLNTGIINLTTQGRALENGTAGGAVKVMNLSSKQTVSGIVTGTQTVNVATPAGLL